MAFDEQTAIPPGAGDARGGGDEGFVIPDGFDRLMGDAFGVTTDRELEILADAVVPDS